MDGVERSNVDVDMGVDGASHGFIRDSWGSGYRKGPIRERDAPPSESIKERCALSSQDVYNGLWALAKLSVRASPSAKYSGYGIARLPLV